MLVTSNWYDRQVPGLGNSFIAQVDAVFEQLGQYPEMYQVVFTQVRRAVLHSFPFGVIYQFVRRPFWSLACSRAGPTRSYSGNA